MAHDDETGRDPKVYNQPVPPAQGHDQRLPYDPEHPLAQPGVTVEAERDQEARRRQLEQDEREAEALREVGQSGYGAQTPGTHRPADMGADD